MQGTIRLSNIVLYGFHGVLESEKELLRRFEIDVELQLDLSAATVSDDVKTSIDYSQVSRLIKEIFERKRFNLIEALTAALADALLREFRPVSVTVRVRKRFPPLAENMDFVEVEVTKRQ